MQSLNQKATDTFLKIIDGMEGYKKIDNTGGAFMPLSVEKLYQSNIGTVYSLSHYYEQNGDLMRDPDMEFILTEKGKVFPAMFRMDNPPVYEESIFNDGTGWKTRPKLQKQHTSFANQWLKNIKAQQKI